MTTLERQLTPPRISYPDFQYIGQEPMAGERPKTTWQMMGVQVVQEMVGTHLHKMGVSGNILTAERIHFLEPEVYATTISARGFGRYFPETMSAVVRMGAWGETLSTLTEEVLHAASYQSQLYSPSAREVVIKCGYAYVLSGPDFKRRFSLGDNQAEAASGRVDEIPFFRGFDEGVINILKRTMLRENLPWLQPRFGLSSSEAGDLVPADSSGLDYPYYRSRVEAVALRIGVAKRHTLEEILRYMQRGLFLPTPGIFSLINEVLGENQFRDLAAMGDPGQATLVQSCFEHFVAFISSQTSEN